MWEGTTRVVRIDIRDILAPKPVANTKRANISYNFVKKGMATNSEFMLRKIEAEFHATAMIIFPAIRKVKVVRVISRSMGLVRRQAFF